MATKRYFAQKDNQDLFCRLLDENEGHVEKTLADKRISKSKMLLYNEWNKHGNKDFKKRVNKIQKKHEKKYKDKEWGESTSERFRKLHNYQMEAMERDMADGKEIDNKELNLLRFSMDDHLKSRAQIDSYRAKTKKLKQEIEAGASGGNREQNTNEFNIKITPAG